MMFSYPYFHSPYYPRYSRYGYSYPNSSMSNNKKNDINKTFSNDSKNESINHVHTTKQSSSYETKKEESSYEDSPLFEIFGISLYFDDILLICLIFFLYQEGVKDESLFMALILLLLS